jgi:phosphoserine phosphatase
MIIASDLNGTLTRGSPILGVVKWVENHVPEVPTSYFKFRVVLSYLQVRAGLMDTHSWANIYLREALDLISSPTPEILDQLMSFLVDDELWPKKISIAVDLLKEFHQLGAEIILVSAAYEPAVIHFGHKIALDRISGIGTPVSIRDDRFSLAEQLTIRERKMIRLNEMLGSRKLEYALGDSMADLPMLKAARNPIAVYPDKKLRLIALENNWRILE